MIKATLSEWMAVERNRIEVMELWPDGPGKEAGLASARSTLESLVGCQAAAQPELQAGAIAVANRGVK
jgi:hypothetical protein